MSKLTAELKAYFSEKGKKGGKARAKKYSTADFKRWGKKGGRPKILDR